MIRQADAATAVPAALKPLVDLTTLSVVTAQTYFIVKEEVIAVDNRQGRQVHQRLQCSSSVQLAYCLQRLGVDPYA